MSDKEKEKDTDKEESSSSSSDEDTIGLDELTDEEKDVDKKKKKKEKKEKKKGSDSEGEKEKGGNEGGEFDSDTDTSSEEEKKEQQTINLTNGGTSHTINVDINKTTVQDIRNQAQTLFGMNKFDLYCEAANNPREKLKRKDATLVSYGIKPKDSVFVQYKYGCCDSCHPGETILIALAVICAIPTCCYCFLPTCGYCCFCCGKCL